MPLDADAVPLYNSLHVAKFLDTDRPARSIEPKVPTNACHAGVTRVFQFAPLVLSAQVDRGVAQ